MGVRVWNRNDEILNTNGRFEEIKASVSSDEIHEQMVSINDKRGSEIHLYGVTVHNVVSEVLSNSSLEMKKAMIKFLQKSIEEMEANA
jgi:ribosomal protein L9